MPQFAAEVDEFGNVIVDEFGNVILVDVTPPPPPPLPPGNAFQHNSFQQSPVAFQFPEPLIIGNLLRVYPNGPLLQVHSNDTGINVWPVQRMGAASVSTDHNAFQHNAFQKSPKAFQSPDATANSGGLIVFPVSPSPMRVAKTHRVGLLVRPLN